MLATSQYGSCPATSIQQLGKAGVDTDAHMVVVSMQLESASIIIYSGIAMWMSVQDIVVLYK